MKRFTWQTLLVLLLMVGCFAPVVSAQIVVSPIEQQGAAGVIRGFVARIDLADPRVSVHVTAPFDRSATTQPVGADADALLVPTDKWAEQNNLTLAVNANFFGWVKGGANIVGLTVSDRKLVSEARSWDGKPDPAIVFVPGPVPTTPGEYRGVVARIIGPGQPEVPPSEIVDAVAGVGGGEKDKTPGTLLVQAGKNLGATARVSGAQRHPRTAIGIADSGKRVIVVVVDGRQPDWSVGMTLPELADLMIQLGATDAINLDGGGSSAFIYRPDPARPALTNRPSDKASPTTRGIFRPVANSLGFKVSPADTQLSKPTAPTDPDSPNGNPR